MRTFHLLISPLWTLMDRVLVLILDSRYFECALFASSAMGFLETMFDDAWVYSVHFVSVPFYSLNIKIKQMKYYIFLQRTFSMFNSMYSKKNYFLRCCSWERCWDCDDDKVPILWVACCCTTGWEFVWLFVMVCCSVFVPSSDDALIWREKKFA